MDMKKLKEYRVIIIAGVIVCLLLLTAFIVSVIPNGVNSGFRGEPQITITIAEPSNGPLCANSDIRIIDGTIVLWPDKLSDIEEVYVYGTNMTNPDTDGDGMEDGWEAFYSIQNPITGKLTLDPNRADALENPDGDGYDEYPTYTETLSGITIPHKGNGIMDGDDNLTNIEEYIGGSWTGEFQDLVPGIDNQAIAMLGGFHLAWTQGSGVMPTLGTLGPDYLNYNPYRDPAVTTNPSSWDTDHDGMDDGYESHFQGVCAALGGSDVYFEDSETKTWSIGEYDFSLSPLDPTDGNKDFDVRSLDVDEMKEGPETVFYPDTLTNLEEYQNATDPTKWDTDGDSYFDPVTQRYQAMDDLTEVTAPALEGSSRSNIDWNSDGVLDTYTNPNNPDTDGDLMPDGWEMTFGLNPLNSSDRFLDLDGDGLQNYQEFSFPSYQTRYFTTDPFDPDTDDDGMPDGWEAYNAKLLKENQVDVEADKSDGIPDGFDRLFSVNPMVSDWALDSDGFWQMDEGSGEYVFISAPDNLTNIEEWVPGYWLDGITPEMDANGAVWVPNGFYLSGTDPNVPDTDGDMLSDGTELKAGFPGQLIGEIYFTNDAFCQRYYTNASNADTDSDSDPQNTSRVLDDWEETHGQNREVMDNDGVDNDNDGTVDEPGELLTFSPTNASNPDSDLDGLNDVDELFGVWTGAPRQNDPTSGFGWVRTDACAKDTDLDHMSDNMELAKMVNSKGSYKPYITNPLDPDTDDDGLEDGLEWSTDFYPYEDAIKTDNWDADSDGDLTDDGDILNTIDRTDPRLADTDSDGLPDGWEQKWGSTADIALVMEYDAAYGTNIASKITEGMTVWLVNPLEPNDVFQDPDGDDLTNYEEYLNGTDPLNWDTDGDGMSDSWEITCATWTYDTSSHRWGWNLDPLDPLDWCEDPDHDGVYYALWTWEYMTGWRYVTYYWPWCNLYEYQTGENPDGDHNNEDTTLPNEKDTDSDGMPDGFEWWFADTIINASKPNIYRDNDGLPVGWEAFFNGTFWCAPETYLSEVSANWTVLSQYGMPSGIQISPDNFRGKLDPTKANSDGVGNSDRDEDYDGDGYTNFLEYRTHTDPTNTQSKPGVGR